MITSLSKWFYHLRNIRLLKLCKCFFLREILWLEYYLKFKLTNKNLHLNLKKGRQSTVFPLFHFSNFVVRLNVGSSFLFLKFLTLEENMKSQTQTLDGLFIEELEDMYSSENQIIESLPKLIKLASSEELKKALTKHLKETQHQVTRLEKIFSLLNLTATEKTCEAMQGILQEVDDLVENHTKTNTLDAAIISAAQKVEHYEIASYGSLRSFAKNLEFDNEIVNLIQDTLDEEVAADKGLTKIAEGSLFSSGVNKKAAESAPKHK